MKRFRVKVVGLGLALLPAAGTAVAVGADWSAPGQPAAQTVGTPGLLPPTMRAGSPNADTPIWVPTRQSHPAEQPILPAGGGVPAPAFVPPAVVPPPAPQAQIPAPPQPQPQPQPRQQPSAPTVSAPERGSTTGPRANGPLGPLPAIPVLPDATEVPITAPLAAQPTPVPLPPAPAPRPSDPLPLPQPKPAEPPMMMPPHAPNFLPPRPTPQPLPIPRPVDAPPAVAPPVGTPPELQPAPAELMIPSGALEVGGKHTLFGSPPIRLSRDYPPLRDLVHKNQTGDLTILNDGPADGGAFNRFFVRGEYLLWWMPGFATPVLGTTNPNTALNGYLGEPGTTAIFGPGSFLGSTRSGFRIRAGAWLDDCGSCGIDGSFFFLGNRSASMTTNSDQNPLITRPVFVPNFVPGTNVPLGENGEAVAVPGILRGALTVAGDSRLWGADVNLRKCLLNRCDVRAEVFAGYRYLNLRESLSITEDITVIGPGGDRIALMDPVGTHVVVQDRFQTQNYFNGGQIGGLYERRMGRWSWDARGSFAMGSTHQVLEIDGFQVRQPPGAAPMTFRGGLLAAGSNIGRFTSDRFSVAPEFSLNVGYFVLPNLRVYAGYNFLLWTNVIRPGDQIDHTVDLTLVPNALPTGFSGQFRPHPLFKQTDLVVNGIQFGLDWRW